MHKYKQLISNYLYKNRKAIPYLVYSVLGLIITYRLLLTPGSLGLGFDWAFNDSPKILSNYSREVFNAYSDRYIGNSPTYDTSYFYSILIALLAFTGVSGGWISKILLFLGIVIAGCFMYMLLIRSFKFSYQAAFWGGFVYMLSPFIFYKSVAGHLYEIVSYAMLPLLSYLVIEGLSSRDRRRVILYALTSSIVLLFIGAQIQFILFGLLVILLFSLSTKATVFNKLLFIMITSGSIFVFSLPWLLPLIFNKSLSDSFVGKFTSLKVIQESKFLSYFNSLQGREGYGFFYQRTLSSLPLPLKIANVVSGTFFIGLIIYGITTLLHKEIKLPSIFKRRILAISLVLVLLVLLFFIKGVNEPFGGFNIWLFEHISALGLFRNLYHLVGLSLFISVILASLALNKIYLSRRISLVKLNIIIAILFLGLTVVYYSGNFGGFVRPYQTGTQLEKLNDEISNKRVIFFPNLQPYIQTNSDSTLGGWDSFQASSSASSIHQGQGITEAQKYPLLNLNACMIFKENCNDTIKNYMSNQSIEYIVYRKDIESIYYRVSGIGGDKLKDQFINADYQTKLNATGYKKVEENEKYVLYKTDIQNHPITSSNQAFSYVAGSDNSSINSKINSSFIANSNEGAVLADSYIVNNNATKLVDIKENSNSTIIEPGYYLNNSDWKSYLSYWWRDHYLDSGFNGVRSDTNNSEFKFTINVKKTGKNNIWISSTNLSGNDNSNILISIPSAHFSKVVNLTSKTKSGGLINIGSNINFSKSTTIQLTSISGKANIDAIYLEPSTDKAEEAEIVGQTSSNPDVSISDQYLFKPEISELNSSSTSSIKNSLTTKYQADKISYTISNSKTLTGSSGYIKTSLNTNDISLKDFLTLDTIKYSYTASQLENTNVKIDTTLNIGGPNNFNENIVLSSDHLTTSSGDISVPISGLNNQLSSNKNLLGKDRNELTIRSISLYINVEPVKQGNTSLDIGSLNLLSSYNQLYSSEQYKNLASKISKSLYYNKLESTNFSNYVNNLPVNFSVTPNTQNSTTQVNKNKNEITLITHANQDISEYAATELSLHLDKGRSIVIPIENDQSISFIDYELQGSTNQTEYTHRATVLDGKSYIVIDSSDINSISQDGNLTLRIFFNKRTLTSAPQHIVFNIDGLYNIDTESIQLSESPLKQTFYTFNKVRSGNYELNVKLSDGTTKTSVVELTEGTNSIPINNVQNTSSISYVSIFNEQTLKNNKSEVISFKKNNSTDYVVNDLKYYNDNTFLSLNTNYDGNWQALTKTQSVGSIKGGNGFNTFNISTLKQNQLTLVYSLQKYRIIGLVVAVTTFFVILILISSLLKHKKNQYEQ